MRLLLVHNRHREPGGEDRVVDAEAQLLRAAGHDVDVEIWANPTGAQTLAAFARAPWNTSAARELATLVRARQPDVVHVHNTWFALSPSVLPAIHDVGVPLVMTLHNYRLMCADHTLFRDGAICRDCVGRGPWRAVAHRCYGGSAGRSAVAAATISLGRRRGAFDVVDRFVAPSEVVRQLHIDAGIAPSRIVMKPHFTEDPGVRRQPPSASRDVLLVGRLADGKGAELALEAWARGDVAARTGCTLRVIGEGPLRAAMERAAPAGVVFEGWLDPPSLRALMLEARALLFASEWLEPFGLTLIEALAAGLPVVGSDIGETPRIVAGGGAIGPPAQLATVLDALADGASLDAYSLVGRQRWTTHYSPEAALPALEAVYQDLL
jgi:glycosyltransferase involved in cell wall biosynthesis